MLGLVVEEDETLAVEEDGLVAVEEDGLVVVEEDILLVGEVEEEWVRGKWGGREAESNRGSRLRREEELLLLR